MAIVFIFLSLLSILMLLMRSFDRSGPNQSATGDVPSNAPGTNRAGSTGGDTSRIAREHAVAALPVWAIAAAAAYLDAERELDRGSASVWTHRQVR